MAQREIKFRVWDNATSIMVFTGFHVIGEVTAFGGIEEHIAQNRCGASSSIERWNDMALMQFTGLNDKTGREIYEGDLPGGIYQGGVVKWCDNCHGWSLGIAEIEGHCHQCDGDFMWRDFVDDVQEGKTEVAGNIHENPDLVTSL